MFSKWKARLVQWWESREHNKNKVLSWRYKGEQLRIELTRTRRSNMDTNPWAPDYKFSQQRDSASIQTSRIIGDDPILRARAITQSTTPLSQIPRHHEKLHNSAKLLTSKWSGIPKRSSNSVSRLASGHTARGRGCSRFSQWATGEPPATERKRCFFFLPFSWSESNDRPTLPAPPAG